MARPKKYNPESELEPLPKREAGIIRGEAFSVPIPAYHGDTVGPIGAPSLSDTTTVVDELELVMRNPYDSGTLESRIFELCKESACSMKELSILLEISEKMLEEEFADVIQKGLTVCKVLLRRTQMRSAKVGDAKMMTFLGKNVLGQEEKVEGVQGNVTIVISTGVPRTSADVVIQQGASAIESQS